MTQSFWLPFPPTTNNLFFNAGKRRVRTKGYDAWIAEALAALSLQKPQAVSGPYRLTIVANRPDRRRRDLGNLEKPLSDLLVKAGLVADDCDAQRIMLCWSKEPPRKPATVILLITREAA